MHGLHWDTISPQMKDIMITFGESELGRKFYLAGRTALALHLGHRKSVDLDFFSKTEDVSSIKQQIEHSLQSHNPILADKSWGNLIFLVGSVRVGFFSYGYSLVNPFIMADNCKLASVVDIALMKIDAIMGRASRKDFHDLYSICQTIPLRDLLNFAPRKYPNMRDFEVQMARHLVYFEKADSDTPVLLIKDISWEIVKEYFRKQVEIISKSWIK